MEKGKKLIAVRSQRVTFPRIPPEKGVCDYLTSKAQFERIHVPDIQGDIARDDPYMQLVSTNRVLAKTKDLLERKREDAKLARAHLAEQWKELKEKEENLRENFEAMSTFVQSNAEKRRRAVLRAEEDHALVVQRIDQIERMKKRVEYTENAKVEMEQNIDSLRIYQKFLNEVVNVSDEFKNADDIVARYETLVTTRNLLGERQGSSMRELETARTKMGKMHEENKLILIGLNTILAGLRSRYATALRNSIHWELVVTAIRDNMYKNHAEISVVKQSSWNLYKMMCARKNEAPKLDEEEIDKQLLFMKRMLQELTKIKSLEIDASSKQLLVKKEE